jgi:predicted nuclease of predicted toxin-antitoxin system
LKLLFDQNLSSKLVKSLADLFPDSLHVKDLGMEQTDDRLIWERAKQDGLIIVSKDSDFYQRAVLFGHPPKVIWIKRGNCPTKQVEFILRGHFDRIKRFDNDSQANCLILY